MVNSHRDWIKKWREARTTRASRLGAGVKCRHFRQHRSVKKRGGDAHIFLLKVMQMQTHKKAYGAALGGNKRDWQWCMYL